MIQPTATSDLIARIDAEITKRRDREGDMMYFAKPDQLLVDIKTHILALDAVLNTNKPEGRGARTEDTDDKYKASNSL